MEKKNKKRWEQEQDLINWKVLDENLVKMIGLVNEANELCSSLGWPKYNYIPEILT